MNPTRKEKNLLPCFPRFHARSFSPIFANSWLQHTRSLPINPWPPQTADCRLEEGGGRGNGDRRSMKQPVVRPFTPARAVTILNFPHPLPALSVSAFQVLSCPSRPCSSLSALQTPSAVRPFFFFLSLGPKSFVLSLLFFRGQALCRNAPAPQCLLVVAVVVLFSESSKMPSTVKRAASPHLP